MATYELIVGNIGRVLVTDDAVQAEADYATYVEQSKSGAGRAAGESVTLFKDNEIALEYEPEDDSPKWVVGSNMPGYMPDETPHVADNYEHAIGCMIGDLENDRDDLWQDKEGDEEATEDGVTEGDYDQVIYALESHLERVKRGDEKPQEQGVTIGDRHYFVAYAVD